MNFKKPLATHNIKVQIIVLPKSCFWIVDRTLKLQHKNMPGQPGIHHLYSNAEDRVILKFILSNNLQHRMKGAAIYKRMEEEQILPNRTWQSLQSRVKNYILPDCLSSIYGLTEQEKDDLRPYLNSLITQSGSKSLKLKTSVQKTGGWNNIATSSTQNEENSTSYEPEEAQALDEPIILGTDSETYLCHRKEKEHTVKNLTKALDKFGFSPKYGFTEEEKTSPRLYLNSLIKPSRFKSSKLKTSVHKIEGRTNIATSRLQEGQAGSSKDRPKVTRAQKNQKTDQPDNIAISSIRNKESYKPEVTQAQAEDEPIIIESDSDTDASDDEGKPTYSTKYFLNSETYVININAPFVINVHIDKQ